MDVWFCPPAGTVPRGLTRPVLHAAIAPGRLFEHVDRATPSALLTLLIMEVPGFPQWGFEVVRSRGAPQGLGMSVHGALEPTQVIPAFEHRYQPPAGILIRNLQ